MIREKRHILFDLPTTAFSLRGVGLFAILYLGSLATASVLGLLAFKITHAVDPDASSYLANKPFPRFFDRARWISVLAVLPFLFLSCRLTSFRAIGFRRPFAVMGARWFIIGIGMIGLVYGAGLAYGSLAFIPHRSFASLPKAALDALLAALFIGILEEMVFRGLVFRLFYTAFRPVTAIIVSSLCFAALHLEVPAHVVATTDPSQIGLAESLSVAWDTLLAPFVRFDPTYLGTIVFVGIVLHQVFLIEGNLWANIALHAGWVFTIRLASPFLANTEKANGFTGTDRVADGIWVVTVLVGFAILFAFWLQRQQAASNSIKKGKAPSL